jgi:hypothetical protein
VIIIERPAAPEMSLVLRKKSSFEFSCFSFPTVQVPSAEKHSHFGETANEHDDLPGKSECPVDIKEYRGGQCFEPYRSAPL